MDKKITLYRWTRNGWLEVDTCRGHPGRAAVTNKQPTFTEYPCSRCGRVFAYRRRWINHECLADLT